MISNITIQILIEMMNATSDDATRHSLQHVRVQKKNYGESSVLVLTATDGHILARREVKDDGLLELLKTGDVVLFHQDEIKSLKDMIGRGPGAQASIDGDRLKFTLGHQSLTVKINDADFQYPVVDSFFKAELKAPICVTFDARLLLDLAKSLAETKSSKPVSVTLRFDASAIGHPIEVTRLGHEAKGILMPVRGEKSRQETNNATLSYGKGLAE